MRLFSTFLLLWMSSISLAQEPAIETGTSEQLYLTGVSHFQKQQYKEAADSFRLAFQKDRNNRAILYNWGIAEHKLGNSGMAAGAWRRALNVDPEFSRAAKALDFISPQISASRSQDLGFFETFRQNILNHVSPAQLGGTSILLLFSSGWLLLGYLGKRRRAFNENTSLPTFPAIGLSLFILCLLSMSIGAAKVYDLTQPRATIITTTASVFSGPHNDSPTLFEVSAGFEVILRRHQEGWMQVVSPGGLSGWMKKDSLFQTSGWDLW